MRSRKPTSREQEKQRLIDQRDDLLGRYAYLNENDPVPEDVLRHCREVVRFRAKSITELLEIKVP